MPSVMKFYSWNNNFPVTGTVMYLHFLLFYYVMTTISAPLLWIGACLSKDCKIRPTRKRF